MDDDDGSGVNLSALNPTILNYYKKFGKKRDLEQYFSLSTAQGDARDPTGIFWKQIKSHSDSSDSGGKRSESSQEVCRISIQCSIPEPSSSQVSGIKTKNVFALKRVFLNDVTILSNKKSVLFIV